MRLGRPWRYFSTLISLLALIGQMLLPVAHAQMMAKRSGDPTLSAFCGQISPALLHQLAETAPPELLKRIRSDQHKLSAMSCDLCASVHANLLAVPPSGHQPDFDVADHYAPADPAIGRPLVRLLRLPPLRGPPLFS